MSIYSSIRSFTAKVILLSVIVSWSGIHVIASDIVQISPLTNKIILIKFDDGSVTYPNTLDVDRLVVGDAINVTSYIITSSDDSDYSSSVNPGDIARKSKGDEFTKSPPWSGVSGSFDTTGKPWVSNHYIYLFLDIELKPGKSYTVNTGSLAANGSEWTFTFDEKSFRSEAVHVNTLGYAGEAPKYGYIYQWMGDRGGADLSEYAGNAFHIYPVGSDAPVLTGVINKRKSTTNPETGQANDTPDQNFLGAEVYECEFTEVKTDGEYILAVEGIGSSYPFKIGEDAVWEAAYATGRALYYQRNGIRLAPPFTDDGYIRPVNQNTLVTSDDGVSFSGKLLYSDYSYMDWEQADGGGESQAAIRDAAIGKPLDVAGWYHDAGDWDGYQSHQRIPVLLMLTYEFAPERFGDDELNLPESGNGIPDILDEASWLIKFNYRLKKELIKKGYSDGGVGGARICADPFSSVDGNAESNLPSWKEYRRTVVTRADAFMTYYYAGQAAQFACILKQLGKDPHAFEVEMLDHVDYESMTKDVVDWEQEARDAYMWASEAENQPVSRNNYDSDLGVYKMYAAANLFRLTNEEVYNGDAMEELQKVSSSNNLADDERYGVYSYLLADNLTSDKALKSSLSTVAESTARYRGINAAEKRALRWGGVFDMPMLVGHGTTPWVFENIVAYALTGDKSYNDVVHTTSDYFLGTNPMLTTWITGVGPRPPHAGFHLDSRYNNNWTLYPGFIPYGPWSMSYGYTPYTWVIDGIEMEGGAGPWNKDWANFSMYPLMENWPGHERWNNNIHAPMSSENTVHQNAVYGALTYGYVNSRMHTNATEDKSISQLTLNENTMTLNSCLQVDTLVAVIDIPDAGFGALIWKSSDPRIAHVDQQGRVTGVTSGTATITCSTRDGSVSSSCEVTCAWTEVGVVSISVEPDSLVLVEGQRSQLEVFFSPDNATNKFIDWSYSIEGVVSVNELDIVYAISPGEVVIIATSLNGEKRDTCIVEVREAVDYIIADFDLVIPVLTTPQTDAPQMYTPEGAGTVDSDNPLVSSSNESAKVAEWSRPMGDWRLLGMVLPTESPQDLSKYAQFQFKYFGSAIRDFFIQFVPETGDNYEISEVAEGENAWKLFTYDLDVSFSLKQFNIFVNKTGNPEEATIYFDDFVLAGKPAVWYEGLTISENYLDLSRGEETALIADSGDEPFTWVSSNPDVATVDQSGLVKAISKGSASIKAVPLYGDVRECIVDVDGGSGPQEFEMKMILDFENFELDWSAGYGSYSWASATQGKTDNPAKTDGNSSEKVHFWDRDGTNYGGGIGIVFPSENTTGWQRLSLLSYAESSISSLRLELLDGDVIIGATEKVVTIPPGEWTTIRIDLADMDGQNAAVNKINFMYGVGTQDVYTVYTDNVMLEKGELPVIEASGIYISGSNALTLNPGQTHQLSAEITPIDATNQTILWSSDQSSIALVSPEGLVTAVTTGRAVIYAWPESDNTLSATVTVTVEEETGIEKYLRNNLVIYPNPAIDRLTIAADANMVSAEIINCMGEVVVSKDLPGASETVLSGLQLMDGLYFLRVMTSESLVFTGLFLIRR